MADPTLCIGTSSSTAGITTYSRNPATWYCSPTTPAPLVGPGNELNESADAAIAKFPFIDGTRQAAGGASYGGHLANWLQATTTRYKCLFSHAGLVNLESQ